MMQHGAWNLLEKEVAHAYGLRRFWQETSAEPACARQQLLASPYLAAKNKQTEDCKGFSTVARHLCTLGLKGV